jgi:MFS family permease
MFCYRSIFAETARPDAIRRNHRAPWFAVGVVCFGAFMGQLDASIVTLTFRPMEHEFATPLAAVQWVSLGYLLALVGLLTPAGRLADAIGRKLVYTYGFVVFTVASAACGLAPSLGTLVAFRLVQAVGAAMLQANSVALVTTSAPRDKTRMALGVQAAAQAIGLALGPTLGGVLTATVGWRYVYWVNVPVGIAALIAGHYLLPRTRQLSRTDRFDWLGTVLLAAATTCVLLALSAASGLSMPGWAVTGLAALAVTAAVSLRLWESRARFPLIPRRFLRSAPLALGLGGALCGYIALFGPLVLIPQVLAGAPGMPGRGGMGPLGSGVSPGGTVSPMASLLHAGLVLTALPVGFGAAALGAETVLPRSWGNRRRGFAGGLACAAAMTGLIFVPMSAVCIAPLLALAGLGLGTFVPANNTVIMRTATDTSAAMLGGLVNMARGIGTTLGISLVALTLHLTAPSGRAAGTAGRLNPRLAFTMLAIVGGAIALIALAGRAAGGTATGHVAGPAPGNTTARHKTLAQRIRSAEFRDLVGTDLADVVSRLRRAMRRAARAADPVTALSVAQLELLSCLAEHPGARPGQLAGLLLPPLRETGRAWRYAGRRPRRPG